MVQRRVAEPCWPGSLRILGLRNHSGNLAADNWPYPRGWVSAVSTRLANSLREMRRRHRQTVILREACLAGKTRAESSVRNSARDFVNGSSRRSEMAAFDGSNTDRNGRISRRFFLGHISSPAFQTGTTDRIASCGATGMTDNDDECLARRALREGLRRGAGRILPVQLN